MVRPRGTALRSRTLSISPIRPRTPPPTFRASRRTAARSINRISSVCGRPPRREGGPMFRELDVGQSALLADIAMCINHYRLFSPGLYCCIHATVELNDGTRFCPGIVVQVNHGPLKQCEPNDCFKGPPNFVLDVFPEGDMLDYARSHDCFERHGVVEYVALRLTEPVEWIWNRLVDGKFSVIETADDELIMSAALHGL